ncbi:N-6 DNA methylase [Alteromonas sp. McT4-15]|uniref:Eco57I restriction-modification methylase domain-containing protein n=1 Tax=Alteromonas sp. McT4-15 TaxID=2881256 RepID=UPI001CF8AD4A|nr:N-6 DNA methylase [Alteromonas sp. McT4-15]MCB4438263.1 N-6 DNA methylase [Alteromonas sp. McT4-15]
MKFKSDQTTQKLRGGYYTPKPLADYVTSWVCSVNPQHILEPSCGDGIFLQSIADVTQQLDVRVTAYELFDVEAEKARVRGSDAGLEDFVVNEGDFLDWANIALIERDNPFDGVVGNPPFIRYQFLEKAFQLNTERVFQTLGLKFTKHTNAWVPFILSSISLLRPGGRLGMVIPSEIVHVLHAQSLRTYLGTECSKVVIIDPQEIWFEGTLQGAVIIMAEKKMDFHEPTQGVAIESVRGFDFLEIDPDQLFHNAVGINGETVAGKWTKALFSPQDLAFYNDVCRHNDVHIFNEIATVDVGIVTGANKFFLIDDDTVEQHALEQYVHPMFGRSEHCKGVLYDERQHQSNRESGNPTNFLLLEEELETYPDNVRQYVAMGEREDLHKRYKCRIRKPWYKVPSVYATAIGMLKRCHDAPRLISNQINAYTTDTAYRIRPLGNVDPETLVYCFMNPITAISAELNGRYYGGGVLELVPSEIEKLWLPIPYEVDTQLELLDEEIRTLPMDEVLRRNGFRVLHHIGLSEQEVDKLVQIWSWFRDRRQRK